MTRSHLFAHMRAQHMHRERKIDSGCRFNGAHMELQFSKLMSNVLFTLARALNVSTLKELVTLVERNTDIYPECRSANQWAHMVPDVVELHTIQAFGRFLGVTVPSKVTLLPPNTEAALVHWRPLLILLQLAPPDVVASIKSTEVLCDNLGNECTARFTSTPQPVPTIADAHMHLDEFQRRAGHKLNLARLKNLGCCDVPTASLQCCIANNSFPRLKDHPHWLLQPSDVSDAKVKMAYSIHPKTAGDLSTPEMAESLLEELEMLLSHQKTVALAEVGLDFSQISATSSEAANQRHYFKVQLRMAKERSLPVTLHCRDKIASSEAQCQMIGILEEVLPPNYHLYWHCFLGDLASYRKLARKFPNLRIGIGPKACNEDFTRLAAVLHEIPMNHLLFETDAPLQVPAKYRRQRHSPVNHPLLGNPYMVRDVAQMVSNILMIPEEALCTITTKNTCTFFKC